MKRAEIAAYAAIKLFVEMWCTGRHDEVQLARLKEVDVLARHFLNVFEKPMHMTAAAIYASVIWDDMKAVFPRTEGMKGGAGACLLKIGFDDDNDFDVHLVDMLATFHHLTLDQQLEILIEGQWKHGVWVVWKMYEIKPPTIETAQACERLREIWDTMDDPVLTVEEQHEERDAWQRNRYEKRKRV